MVQVARPEDEVLLRLESQGGMVHTYGLAASQLRRLKSAGIRLTAVKLPPKTLRISHCRFQTPRCAVLGENAMQTVIVPGA